jgi:hypothetical protein
MDRGRTPKTREEMLQTVRKLVAEYSEFQRTRPDLPQGDLWGLSQNELEKLVTAYQQERSEGRPLSMPPRSKLH